MRGRVLRAAVTLLVAVVVSGCALQPRQVLGDGAAQRILIAGRPFQYCASAPVQAWGQEIRRVIIAVHGLDRAACAMRDAVVAALGGEPADTVVIAPHFSTSADAPTGGFAWGPSTWPAGEPDRGGVSSFAVMDALVEAVGDRSITLVGFSGGGQFTNRYAAVSRTMLDRYVIINPSSYVWLTADRPRPSASCPTFNDWRYGLDGRAGYAETGNPEEIRERYASRGVRYLIGTADDDPNSTSLDRSCAAQTQGANREERAVNYHAHLVATFGQDVGDAQPLVTVAGVGHDARRMLASEAGRASLTGRGRWAQRPPSGAYQGRTARAWVSGRRGRATPPPARHAGQTPSPESTPRTPTPTSPRPTYSTPSPCSSPAATTANRRHTRTSATASPASRAPDTASSSSTTPSSRHPCRRSSPHVAHAW